MHGAWALEAWAAQGCYPGAAGTSGTMPGEEERLNAGNGVCMMVGVRLFQNMKQRPHQHPKEVGWGWDRDGLGLCLGAGDGKGANGVFCTPT